MRAINCYTMPYMLVRGGPMWREYESRWVYVSALLDDVTCTDVR